MGVSDEAESSYCLSTLCEADKYLISMEGSEEGPTAMQAPSHGEMPDTGHVSCPPSFVHQTNNTFRVNVGDNKKVKRDGRCVDIS